MNAPVLSSVRSSVARLALAAPFEFVQQEQGEWAGEADWESGEQREEEVAAQHRGQG